jgi:hypothetical protein
LDLGFIASVLFASLPNSSGISKSSREYRELEKWHCLQNAEKDLRSDDLSKRVDGWDDYGKSG